MKDKFNLGTKKAMGLGKRKYAFLLITYALLLAAFLYYVKDIWGGFVAVLAAMRPLFYGIAIAFVLNVLMSVLERKIFNPWAEKRGRRAKKACRGLALFTTILLTVGILYGLFAFILPQFIQGLSSLLTALPDYFSNFTAMVTDLFSRFDLDPSHWESLVKLGGDALDQALDFLKTSLPTIFGVTVNIGIGVGSFILGIFFSIYMLYNKERLLEQLRRTIRAFLPQKWADSIFYVSEITNSTFRSFVGGQLLEALILGTLTYVGLLILRFPYALVISVVICITSLIPIVGAILGVIPSALLLLVFNPMQALAFVVFIIVLQQIEGNFIYPKVVGNSVGLSAFWVLFAILVGGSLFGFAGILLGVPVCAVLGTILSDAVKKRLGEHEAASGVAAVGEDTMETEKAVAVEEEKEK